MQLSSPLSTSLNRSTICQHVSKHTNSLRFIKISVKWLLFDMGLHLFNLASPSMSFSSCKSHCRIRFSISFLSTIRCPDKTRVLRELIQLLLANALYQLQIPHLKSSPTIYLECDLLNARRWNFHYKRVTFLLSQPSSHSL